MYNSYRLRLIVTATSLTLLSACGQSGPLYLPEDAPQNQPQPVQLEPEQDINQSNNEQLAQQ